jgi:FAD:protein FMN transferase
VNRRLLITAVLAIAFCIVSAYYVSPPDSGPNQVPTETKVETETNNQPGKLASFSWTVMTTSAMARASFPGKTDSESLKLLKLAAEESRRVEKLMSRFIPESDVSRISKAAAGAGIKIHQDTLRVLQLSMQLYKRSAGAFDITVGPLVKLYRKSYKEHKKPPGPEEVSAACKLVGSDKLKIDSSSGTATLLGSGMNIDLSAVAKGFSVDLVIEKLQALGANAGLVEIGGEVRVFGLKPGGKTWTVGVNHPRKENVLLAALTIKDGSLATSGDYQQFFKLGKRRASHIIDPRNGRPVVGGAISVSVLAPTCALADGLATAISVLGPAQGLKLIETYRKNNLEVEALIIEETPDQKLIPHRSPGLKNLKLNL